MASGNITASTVNALQAADRDVILWDEKLAGFGVKVTPAGGKVYILQYRMGGRNSKTRRYTIGREGSPWRPASARKEAERLLAQVRQGVDICERAKENKRNSAEYAFDSFLEGQGLAILKRRWAKSWQEAKRTLDKHALPAFRSKALPDITPNDIERLLDKLADRPATQRQIYAILSALFGRKGAKLDPNPFDRVDAPPALPSRTHTLNDDEMRWCWLAAGEIGFPFGPMVKGLMLTGQRRNEVAGLPWQELDRKVALWRNPGGERSKNGLPNDVPIGSTFQGLIDDLAGGEKWPRSGLLLSTNGETPPSGFAGAKRRLDAEMTKLAKQEGGSVRPWVFHDLRRTMATQLQGLGVRHEVTEHLLNHKEKSRVGVAAIYQRGDYADEKRDAIRKWEARLTRIVMGDGAKVVPLRSA